ncbi:hypothetical protein A3Q56_03414 [Intoshia linei]|uniref:Uncharacterized protein n=1 Tax=Intoshia linei TaxID=1819745 RepID=A0A177B571_9BILA|nr:hypothetical protein A3Q56_03414 [Intoshia linei]
MIRRNLSKITLNYLEEIKQYENIVNENFENNDDINTFALDPTCDVATPIMSKLAKKIASESMTNVQNNTFTKMNEFNCDTPIIVKPIQTEKNETKDSDDEGYVIKENASYQPYGGEYNF